MENKEPRAVTAEVLMGMKDMKKRFVNDSTVPPPNQAKVDALLATAKAKAEPGPKEGIGEALKAEQTRKAEMEFAELFVDAADFLAQELPPPKWIVRDFIAQGMKGDLCGSSKTYKTYLALNLAVSVAAGKDFLDRFKIDKNHVVAYLNLELFDWNFQERLTAQTSADGLGIEREALRGKLLVCNLRSNPTDLREKTDGLIEYLAKRNVEFVVVDPRYKLLQPGEDENTGDGLRGILEMRDRLAKHFAVMLVTHDPKGETAQKKTTDRGAGSYTAGADFDFRITIDKADGWRDGNLVYVIGTGGRARKTPPDFAVRFDETAQVFRADETVAALKQDNRLSTRENAVKRAAGEVALKAAYKRAALGVVETAGDNILSVTLFDSQIAQIPSASLPVNKSKEERKALVDEGILATCKEMRRKPDGSVVGKLQGKTFISTPERIAAYRAKFETLGL